MLWTKVKKNNKNWGIAKYVLIKTGKNTEAVAYNWPDVSDGYAQVSQAQQNCTHGFDSCLGQPSFFFHCRQTFFSTAKLKGVNDNTHYFQLL